MTSNYSFSIKLDRILSLLLTSEQGVLWGKVTAALFAGLAFLGVISMLGTWWSDIRLSTVSKASVITMRNAFSPLQELMQTIPNAHLFGREVRADNAPITSSEVRLTGIVQMGSEEENTSFSKAIISVQGGGGKIYQVGDVLPNGIKIISIEPEAVILDNKGHSERLPLQRPRLEND